MMSWADDPIQFRHVPHAPAEQLFSAETLGAVLATLARPQSNPIGIDVQLLLCQPWSKP